MEKKLINNENISIQKSKYAEILLNSNNYSDFYKNITESEIEYSDQKVYEIASTVFFDFNQHLYEDINHMNSISTGLYVEMSFVTYRIFIWSSKGEGFEIFKHVLRGEEISKLNSLDDIKVFLSIHLEELEKGILSAYNADAKKSFEAFGIGIEEKKLPLANILKFISIDNNMNDFR